MFHGYVPINRGGSDQDAAFKTLVTGEAQSSKSGRFYTFEEIETDFMEMENSAKVPFSDIQGKEEVPEIIEQLENYSSYREFSRIDEREEKKRDNTLEEIMCDVEQVFEDYLKSRNEPYDEFEEEIPDVPEDIHDHELRKEMEEIKELVESRKNDISTLEIDPLTLVELFKIPSDNVAVPGDNYYFDVDDERHRYKGVDEEKIEPLMDSLVSRADIPVNTTRNVSLFTRLPSDNYMEEAANVVREYSEELEVS